MSEGKKCRYCEKKTDNVLKDGRVVVCDECKEKIIQRG